MTKDEIIKIVSVGAILGLILTCNLIFYPCCLITFSIPGLIIIHLIYQNNPNIGYKESIKYTLPTGALSGLISNILIAIIAVVFSLMGPKNPFSHTGTKEMAELMGTGLGIMLAPCICAIPGVIYGGFVSITAGLLYLFIRKKH